MSFFWYQHKVSIIFVLLAVLSVGMLTFPQASCLNRTRSLFIYLFAPSQEITTKLAQNTTGFWDNISALVNAREENTELHEAIQLLKNNNNKLEEDLKEYERLKKLLQLKESLPYSTTVARVIARSPGEIFTTVIIDKGKKDGIGVNMPVVSYYLDTQGVVGKVLQVTNEASTVLLLTNPLSKISAVVSRTRFDGLIEGIGESQRCLLNYVPIHGDVRQGDVIITSGKGSLFPEGILIGKVRNVNINEGELYKSADVELVIDLGKLEEVLVVRTK
ncbi:MAG: rod shape-determining protein MreC [bacterium]